jgi:sulfhydrogenase subunit beta (sulfur reductase)
MKYVTQAQLNEWLDSLASQVSLVAPVDVGGPEGSTGKLLYRPVGSSAEIDAAVCHSGPMPTQRRTMDGASARFERTDMSPKTWLFPETEPILIVEQGKETTIRQPPAPRPTVVFGVRPCDARGALAIDALFLDKAPGDGQYARHREASTLIGLACPQQWESCFCTVVGGAPNGTDGLDVLLTELDGGYAVEVLSEKGAKVVASLAGEERDVTLPAPKLREGLPTLRASDGWEALFNEQFWQRVSDRCLSCRTCTFVCPTCRCFDVRDEVVTRRPGEQVYERLRAWDACTSAAYRRIAGGHNPRPTQEHRLRNRFYCKFMYYPEDFGPLGCVGCGRCIDACPVNIDILEVIAAVEQMAV